MLPSNTAADAAYFRGKSPTLLERKRGNENTLRGAVGQLKAVLGLLILAVLIIPPGLCIVLWRAYGLLWPVPQTKRGQGFDTLSS